MAKARKRKKTKAGGRKRTSGRATKPKKRAKRGPKRSAKPKARTRRAAKPTARAKRRVAPRAKARAVTSRPPQPATAAFAPPPIAPAAAPADGLRDKVEAALVARGYHPPEATVVDVLTAIGRGYEQGPSAPPAGLNLDIDGPVSDGLADRYAKGDRAPFPVRSAHRHPIRSTVDFNLVQLGLGSTSEAAREALTSFCLGSWNPDADPITMRDAIAGPVVAWYRTGLG